MTSPLRIIFAGTPEFAATALTSLLETQHDVIAVYTQPDRPAGRGRKLKPSPVKALAVENTIPVFQPASFKAETDQKQLQELEADVMIVAAYGLLLPTAILEAPRLGCLNIHASLLPRWRGAAPIQRAILAGDRQTGITIMQMNEGLDTGDMLLKISCDIHPEDTGSSLHDRLAELGGAAIVEALEKLEQLTPESQDENKAIYAKKLNKLEAIIDWQQSAESIDRQIRAFNAWPVAQTKIDAQVLRIWEASTLDENSTQNPGSVIRSDKHGIDIACGSGILRINKLQPAGSKPMSVTDFLNGRADLLKPGTQLET